MAQERKYEDAAYATLASGEVGADLDAMNLEAAHS